MTEITRVPLRPIAKGSLTKLWLGVLAAIAVAAGAAWAAMPAGVSISEIVSGEGDSPGAEDVVFIKYTGKLDDGTVFDQSQEAGWPVQGILPDGAAMAVNQSIPGFSQALQQMQKGGKYIIHIPAELGYGDTPPEGAPIPPGADLTFDVELVDFMTREEAEQRYQTMIQTMQQLQGAGGPGGPGSPEAPAPSPQAPQ